MSRLDYTGFPGFSNIYLEDSYLLNVFTNEGVSMSVEAVLLEGHPLYEKPPSQERFCYRNAVLEFPKTRRYSWKKKVMKPIVDPELGIDYGNIDFFFEEGGRYRIGGEWGELLVEAGVPTISIIPKQG